MDPKPFKHPAEILGKIRDAIAPALDAAGFQLDGRNKPPFPVHLYLDYSRGEDLFRLSWERREEGPFIGFTAEVLRASGAHETIISQDLSYLAELTRPEAVAEVQRHIEAIAQSINDYLQAMT